MTKLIRVSILALLFPCLAPVAMAAKGRPNVVILVIDDLGWGDLSCNGGKAVATPHLDALLHRGLSFTNGYVAAPICAPSRAAIMSGRCPARLALTANHQALPVGERTMAELFKAQGYATAAYGKWHMSGVDTEQKELLPTSRGFDVFDGLMGHSGRTDPQGVAHDVDLCLGFLAQNADKPCFVYVGLGPVHTPLTKDPAYLAAVKNDDIAGTRRQYLACLLGLDDAMARFVEGMNRTHAWENTIVWVINDNGGKLKIGSTNLPWRDGKYSLYEGGIHVPFGIIAEGRVKQGTYEGLTSSMDILPTTLEAAGLPAVTDRPLDGRSLWPQFSSQQKQDASRALIWRGFEDCEQKLNCTAIRLGQWKLLHHDVPNKARARNADQLYDLAADPGETKNCADQHPDIVANLVKALDDFTRNVAVPPDKTNSSKKAGKSEAD